MQKEKLIGKRVVVWSKNNPYHLRSGEVSRVFKQKIEVFVEMDQTDHVNNLVLTNFSRKELYFPDDIRGYNQPCFNQ